MVITSPPYYGMRTYVPDQWLRNWFVGGPDHVDYAQPRGSIEHSSPEGFCAELHQVWSGLAEHANDNARLVIRIGGINDREADPKKFAKNLYLALAGKSPQSKMLAMLATESGRLHSLAKVGRVAHEQNSISMPELSSSILT